MVIGPDFMSKPKVTKAIIADENMLNKNFPADRDDQTLPIVPTGKTGQIAKTEPHESSSTSAESNDKTLEIPVQKPFRAADEIIKALEKSKDSQTLKGQHPLAGTLGDLRCPNCHLAHRAGELACIGCGIVFSSAAATHKLDPKEEVKLQRTRYVGDAVTD